MYGEVTELYVCLYKYILICEATWKKGISGAQKWNKMRND